MTIYKSQLLAKLREAGVATDHLTHIFVPITDDSSRCAVAEYAMVDERTADGVTVTTYCSKDVELRAEILRPILYPAFIRYADHLVLNLAIEPHEIVVYEGRRVDGWGYRVDREHHYPLSDETPAEVGFYVGEATTIHPRDLPVGTLMHTVRGDLPTGNVWHKLEADKWRESTTGLNYTDSYVNSGTHRITYLPDEASR